MIVGKTSFSLLRGDNWGLASEGTDRDDGLRDFLAI